VQLEDEKLETVIHCALAAAMKKRTKDIFLK
jgi:hypothetical protein